MASEPPEIEERLRKAWNRTLNFFETSLQAYVDAGNNVMEKVNETLRQYVSEPTLEDTLVEKIGGGPHGYGKETSLISICLWIELYGLKSVSNCLVPSQLLLLLNEFS